MPDRKQRPNQSDRGPTHAKSKTKINWSHPLVLLVMTSVLGAGGWTAKEWYSTLDDTSLRADLEHPRQAVQITGPQLKLLGEPVFCDTAAVSLLLAHSDAGRRPITVNNIQLVMEPIDMQSIDHVH